MPNLIPKNPTIVSDLPEKKPATEARNTRAANCAKNETDPPSSCSLLQAAKNQLTMTLRSSGVKYACGALVLLGITLLPTGLGGALIVGGVVIWLISTTLTALAQRSSHTIPGSIAWSIAMGALGAAVPLVGIGAAGVALGVAVPIFGDMLANYLQTAKVSQ